MIDLQTMKAAINAVVGAGNSHPMTDYFRTGDTEGLFVVVRNQEKQTYYIFYDEQDAIAHKLIGDAKDFSLLIGRCYCREYDVTDSQGFYNTVTKADHVQAKELALASFDYANAQAQLAS